VSLSTGEQQLISHKCSIFNLLIVLVASLIFSSDSSGQIKGYFPKPGPDETVQDVSLLQLIAQPEKFEGKRVRFIGFVRIEFEGNAIYLHREDFDHGITKNGLWVALPADMTKQQQDEVNMHYVICVGVFTAKWQGHMGLFSGEIRNVRRLQLWSDPDQPRSSRPLLPPPPAPSR
jgi:hypothetical protein